MSRTESRWSAAIPSPSLIVGVKSCEEWPDHLLAASVLGCRDLQSVIEASTPSWASFIDARTISGSLVLRQGMLVPETMVTTMAPYEVCNKANGNRYYVNAASTEDAIARVNSVLDGIAPVQTWEARISSPALILVEDVVFDASGKPIKALKVGK